MANALHRQRARANAQCVQLRDKCKVQRIDTLPVSDASKYKYAVHTADTVYRCVRIVLTAGAWLQPLVRDCFNVDIPLRVTQENVTYLDVHDTRPFTQQQFVAPVGIGNCSMPVMIYKGRVCDVYTLPVHGVAAFKIGLDAQGDVVTGDTRTFEPNAHRLRTTMDWLRQYIPLVGDTCVRTITALQALDSTVRETKTCLYTMSNDRHFIVDSLRAFAHPDVFVCHGAGHAFK